MRTVDIYSLVFVRRCINKYNYGIDEFCCKSLDEIEDDINWVDKQIHKT